MSISPTPLIASYIRKGPTEKRLKMLVKIYKTRFHQKAYERMIVKGAKDTCKKVTDGGKSLVNGEFVLKKIDD